MNPKMGEAEVFTREIIKRLSTAGHKITLFTSRFRESKKEEIINGVRLKPYAKYLNHAIWIFILTILK
jgi:hypothetical protein